MDQEALLRCADEPIAIPGAIQPHGVLLAVTEPDLTVVVASANAAELFGYQVTGLPLPDLFDDDVAGRLQSALAGDLSEANPVRVQIDGDVDVVLHRADGLLIAEFEPVAGAEDAGRPGTAAADRAAATGRHRHPRRTAAVLVRDVRTVTGYDRVMIYASTRVERRGDRRGPPRGPRAVFGLRFPASDIPAQARALYATNDRLDVVEFAHGNRHHELVSVVVGQREPEPVEAEERDRRRQRQTFVAVHQRLAAGQRMEEGGALAVDGRIGVLAERRRAWSGQCGLEEPDVAYPHVTERASRHVQQVVEIEVDHWPRRSSASA